MKKCGVHKLIATVKHCIVGTYKEFSNLMSNEHHVHIARYWYIKQVKGKQ